MIPTMEYGDTGCCILLVVSEMHQWSVKCISGGKIDSFTQPKLMKGA